MKNTEADPVQTVPATISDHLAVLEKAGALEAGNIFDTSGLQLWGCRFDSGGVYEKKLSSFSKNPLLKAPTGSTALALTSLIH